MKTELIYSKCRSTDIERAIEEIDRFRQRYSGMLECRPGLFASFRRRKIQQRFAPLIETDKMLKVFQEELEQIRKYVEISNVIQDISERYQGSIDIKVDRKPSSDETPSYELCVITDGYSDDIGDSGSVRLPGMRRCYTLTQDVMDRTFSRGRIDFSWLDGALYDNAQKVSALCGDINTYSDVKLLESKT
ncbi:MAG: hypothetical protein IK115_12680 [Lachnospiraceae bacterium]|nr:hypothetical protein [Lachnospiraceae bacterium]